MAKPAARLSDLNACPITGHGTNPGNSGSGDVNINGMPVLRVGDTSVRRHCHRRHQQYFDQWQAYLLSWAVRRPTEA